MAFPDLFIFDNDGVLVDSEFLGNQVMASVLTDAGYPIGWEDCFRRFLGGTLATVRAEVEAEMGRPLIADFEDRYQDGLFARFPTLLKPIKGVTTVVHGLHTQGKGLCVASSGGHEKINRSLATVGLLHYFEGRIFSGQDVARSKPAPDLFLHAAAACGAAPERCVVVEDSPTGVTGAKAAGMTVIGYAGQVPADELVAVGADVVIHTMADLLDTAARLSPAV